MIYFFVQWISVEEKEERKRNIHWFVDWLKHRSTYLALIVINKMLFLYLISIFNIIQYSLTDKCPSLNNCICSSDLTIITCVNSKLTDESLINLNIVLLKSTILLNHTSNSIKSINFLISLNNIQILDVSNNKIQYLPSNLFRKFRQLIVII